MGMLILVSRVVCLQRGEALSQVTHVIMVQHLELSRRLLIRVCYTSLMKSWEGTWRSWPCFHSDFGEVLNWEVTVPTQPAWAEIPGS